ncbi:MAG: hypothetical protein K9M97_10920 [Akkermansiaceae bacterium]|nr:hypothetical protein [Akkermansiaceae bacterium]
MHLRHLIHLAPDWLDEPSARRVVVVAGATIAGMAIYGFTVGYWRSPLMGCYVAVKLPLLIALTLACNGLLNGLLGMLLGTGLGFRQSLLALLTSFSLAALILGSLAPVTWLLAWNAPRPDSPGAVMAHSAYLLTHTFLIGFAGVTANLHLHRLLLAKAPNRTAATATLLAWLGGNCFLGGQFSWILRPFFGSPQLEVAFLRENPMRGNFYQSVWFSLQSSTGGHGLPVLILILLILLVPVIRAIQTKPSTTPTPPTP